MMETSHTHETFRFRDFALDVASYQLRCNGRAIRLERQPMDLLILLVERRDQLVTRSEIVDVLWGKDVFVDVETGVHTAIRKIRQALHDSPDAPAFVETVPGKGYRFIAPVEVVPAAHGFVAPVGSDSAISRPHSSPQTLTALDDASTAKATAVVPSADPQSTGPFLSRTRWLIAATLVITALVSSLAWIWRGTNGSGSRVTLAVLPFDNLTGDPGREYLADGLQEETIASLGQVNPERLDVLGRTSMMRYKRTTKSLAEIGREVGADYLVESSIRAEKSQLRITTRLIRVGDQRQVWSRSYDRESTGILGLQQELSSAIAEQVRVQLSPNRQGALPRRHTLNPDAYDLYLRGSNYANQRTPETTKLAIENFQHATALDPDYALAWAGIAMAYASSPINGDAKPVDVEPRVREAAERAIRADPNLAEAQASMGLLHWFFDWDWPAAEVALQQAVAMDPNFANGQMELGHVQSQMGQHAEAQATMRRARKLNPFDPMVLALSSQVAFQARDYQAAVQHAQEALAVDPEFWVGQMMLGQAYEQLGRNDEALAALMIAARRGAHNSKPLSLKGYLLARTGRTGEARVLLTMLDTESRYIPPYALALVYAGLDDREATFKYLQKAHAARDVHLMYLPVDPKWDAYRSDPRFAALLPWHAR